MPDNIHTKRGSVKDKTGEEHNLFESYSRERHKKMFFGPKHLMTASLNITLSI